MIKDITDFRIECANCGKFQDLPHNPGLQRVDMEAQAFYIDHAGRTKYEQEKKQQEAKLERPCHYDHLFIRTYAVDASVLHAADVAVAAATAAELMHNSKYGTSNHP